MKRGKFSWLRHLVIASFIVLVLIGLHSTLLPLVRADQKAQAAVFDQVWETINENFFDPKFNGVDWRSLRQKYESSARQAPSQEAFATVVNNMLAELQTSHTRFYIPSEPAYYQILGIFQRNADIQRQLKKIFPQGKIEYSGIGIVTQSLNQQTFISAVLDGSPAAQAGLQVGDRILSVDGRPFHAVQSFANKVGQRVIMQVQRTPTQQQEITVTPKRLDATGMFLEAQKASTTVINRDGRKIGYTHVWSYAGDQYQEQLESDLIYGPLRDADVLLLDLRDGWGGAPITALNIYNNRDLSITSIPRNGKRYRTFAQWHKPVVMLVNGGSRSAKEILAFGFQQYKIGPVVGTKTAGAVVAGRPFFMADNSLLYVAVADVYLNGDRRLEGQGVTPDVVVPFALEFAQGADPQKERAIEVALETLKQKG